MTRAEWNAERDQARRNRPQQGLRISLYWTPDGVVISANLSPDYPHPWQLSCVWKADPKIPVTKGQWTATIRPGFVNGRDVSIDGTPIITEPAPVLAFSGFRDPAAAGPSTTDGEGNAVQPAAEGYPKYFAALGVKPADKSGFAGVAKPDPSRTREIRAIDVVLVTPRAATAQTVDVTDATVDAQNVTISTVFTSTAGPSRLVATPQWTAPAEPTALDRLLGSAVEPTTDELKIATVYFVSQPDAGPSAQPDPSWQPYPLYYAYWNLGYGTRSPLPDAPPDPLQLQVPLAAGVGQNLINAMLSTVNDTFSQISQYLSDTNFSGRYWTVGNLGYLTATRPKRAVAPAAIQGFSPAASTAAAAANAPDPPQLNPQFPFLRIPFDPFFFGLDRDPPAR